MIEPGLCLALSFILMNMVVIVALFINVAQLKTRVKMYESLLDEHGIEHD